MRLAAIAAALFGSACSANGVSPAPANANPPGAAAAESSSGAGAARAGDLFVAYGISAGGVTAYRPGYTGAPAASMLGLSFPLDLALDSHRDLFVADPYAVVSEWKPPYRTEHVLVNSAGYGAVFVDAKNDLFIADTGGSSGVAFVPPPYKKVTRQIVDSYTNYPSALAMDSRRGLFIVNQLGANVAYYPYPYAHAQAAVQGVAVASGAQPIAVDAKGRLFVTNGNAVDVFSRPYRSGTFQPIVTGIAGPQAVAVTPAGELFVANDADVGGQYGTVTVYKPPYQKPIATISGTGVDDPQSLTVDARGTLFVGNRYGGASGEGFVAIFKPPYLGKYASVTNGIGGGVNYVLVAP